MLLKIKRHKKVNIIHKVTENKKFKDEKIPQYRVVVLI